MIDRYEEALEYLLSDEDDEDYLDDSHDYIGSIETLNIYDIPEDSMMKIPVICDKCNIEYKIPLKNIYIINLYLKKICVMIV